MPKRGELHIAPRLVPRDLTIQEYTKRTLNFVERLRIEASKMELGEKRRRQREGDTSQQKLRVAPRVMVLAHSAVELWREAILHARAQSKKDTNTRLTELGPSLKAVCDTPRAASDTPLPLIIRGCEKLSPDQREQLLRNCGMELSADGWEFQDAVFTVTFRDLGDYNLPATFVTVPKGSGSTRALVDDPSHLVMSTLRSIKHRWDSTCARVRKEYEFDDDYWKEKVDSLAHDFYSHTLWDDLVILHHLFKLMRPFNSVKKTKIQPGWTRAPFGRQAWDETIEAYFEDEEIEEIQRCIGVIVKDLGTLATGLEGVHQTEIASALEYFVDYFTPLYRDKPGSQSARFLADDGILYPTYPGYPRDYFNYTTRREDAFKAIARGSRQSRPAVIASNP